MMASSRSSISIPSSDFVDPTWHVVELEKLGKIGNKEQPPPAPQHASLRHRRGRTEWNKRLSLSRMRSRSRTLSNLSIEHSLSPSASFDSQESYGGRAEEGNPESGWSDSDHSDSPRSWMAKGSKMLKKQNSKFNLSSSRRSTWAEDGGDSSEQTFDLRNRAFNKHGRMCSTGTTGHTIRPSISKPYDFHHLTHTQAHQLPDLHSTSHIRLKSSFSAIRASQEPQRELRGIPTEDLESHGSDASRLAYRDPVTPPSFSPTRPCVSRANSSLSIEAPRSLSRCRSIDNFSQPSPRAYRIPPSPGSPPARTSSRNATHIAPDFFSEIHHATPQERELMSCCTTAITDIAPTCGTPGAVMASQSDHCINEDIPHAITTSNDIALTLKPFTIWKGALALADVPEEDEFHSIKRASNEVSRPITADPVLRHATSYPNSDFSPRRRRVSTSRKSLRLSGVMPAGRSLFYEFDNQSENARTEQTDHTVMTTRRGTWKRASAETGGIDACWEDDIDYCYQQEAEADCDFDWDRVSTDQTLSLNGSHQARPSTDAHLDRAQEMSKSAGHDGPSNDDLANIGVCSAYELDGHPLARLQTSFPDLDFSAASSAKSSMASLRGPITPLQQEPSPTKSRPFFPSSKSTDTLNLDSSLESSHECDSQWIQDDPLQKAPTWDHATDFNYPFNNLSISGTGTRTSLCSSRPLLSTHHSLDSVIPTNPSSTAQSRRNTSSTGSFPELVCSRNYRQQATVVAEQVADRMAALQVTGVSSGGPCSLSNSAITKGTMLHSILKKPSISSKPELELASQDPEIQLVPQKQSASVASFASKLRSDSTASSASGSSSTRMSRVSYSLFPTPPATRA